MNAERLRRSFLVGSTAALVGSTVLGLASGILVGFNRHPLEATPWLLAVSLVPSIIVAAIVSALGGSSTGSKRVWSVATVAAIAVVVLAGSVGAITVQALRFGLPRVNWLGYLQWCGVYGVVLLPLTLPLAWGATRLLWRQNS